MKIKWYFCDIDATIDLNDLKIDTDSKLKKNKATKKTKNYKQKYSDQ